MSNVLQLQVALQHFTRCFSNPQLTEVDSFSSLSLTMAFAVFLPAGGIVYTPVIGSMVDTIGPTRGFVVLWAAYLLFQALLAGYALTGFAAASYAAFAVFAFCRPLFYTLGASFTGEVRAEVGDGWG